MVDEHQHTRKQRFPVQNGGSAEGTRDFRPGQGKNLSIITFLSILSPLGLPFEVFLYHLQSRFLVRSWLVTVGPRALTGDQQVKPTISARKEGILYFFKCFNTYTRVGYTQTRVYTRLTQGNVAYKG